MAVLAPLCSLPLTSAGMYQETFFYSEWSQAMRSELHTVQIKNVPVGRKPTGWWVADCVAKEAIYQ